MSCALRDDLVEEITDEGRSEDTGGRGQAYGMCVAEIVWSNACTVVYCTHLMVASQWGTRCQADYMAHMGKRGADPGVLHLCEGAVDGLSRPSSVAYGSKATQYGSAGEARGNFGYMAQVARIAKGCSVYALICKNAPERSGEAPGGM